MRAALRHFMRLIAEEEAKLASIESHRDHKRFQLT